MLKIKKRFFISIVFIPSILVCFLDIGVAWSQNVPVTITITKATDFDFYHNGLYAAVMIDGKSHDSFNDLTGKGCTDAGCLKCGPGSVHQPFWTFSEPVQFSKGRVQVQFSLWDKDNCDRPFCDENDQLDITLGEGKTINLAIDLYSGKWYGDVNFPQRCVQGNEGEICWEVSLLSATGDADGDGLLDGWEQWGYDTDGDGSLEVDLPAYGSDPLHKDLFLEIDWMADNAPTQRQIQAIKRSFAYAPMDAGALGSRIPRGVDANVNLQEDGSGIFTCNDGIDNGGDGFTDENDKDCRGINLWIDTGLLSDPDASEDGFPSGSCSDGIDNGNDGMMDKDDLDCLAGDYLEGKRLQEGGFGPNSCLDSTDNDKDGLTDLQDPDCQLQEGGAGSGSCSDGIDNDNDGSIDYADLDCAGGNEVLAIPILGLDNDYYRTKKENFAYEKKTRVQSCGYITPARKLIFRYGISAAPGFEGGFTPGAAGDSCFNGIDDDGDGLVDIDDNNDCWPGAGGYGELGGNDFIEYNDGGNASAIISNGATIMHEFGHLLNLNHGGEEAHNCKPNYVSIMNYYYSGGITQTAGNLLLDFSPPRGGKPLIDLVENSLSENVALNPSDPFNMFRFVGTDGRLHDWPLNLAVDWNSDGSPPGPPTPGLLSVNIDTADNRGTPNNFDDDWPQECLNSDILGSSEPLSDFNDWQHISLQFRQFGDSFASPVQPAGDTDPNLRELINIYQDFNTTDLSITKAASQEDIEVGSELTYVLTISNLGSNIANGIVVQDILPNRLFYLSDSAECIKDNGNTLLCDLEPLIPGERRDIKIVVGTTDVCVDGIPQKVTNTASVKSLSGLWKDPVAGNNNASLVTTPIDTTPPAIELVGVPYITLECQIDTYSEEGARASDVCDDQITIATIGGDIVDENVPKLYKVTYDAVDTSGNIAPQVVRQVSVVDTFPPVIKSLKASPNVLWPPNHKMVSTSIVVDTSDVCDTTPICKIIAVESNEPVNGTGDGDTDPDWEIIGDLTVNLRAERDGAGTGRIYTVIVECTDASGNSSNAETAVTVIHNK